MYGSRLALIRERRGYTQAELADMVGIGQQQIYRYENGKTQPDGTIVAKLAQVLEVSSDYLLGISDSPVPYMSGDLNAREKEAVQAWRHGDIRTAIKVIVDDE